MKLIEKIRHACIGERTSIETSFGEKPLIYADYTASGRSLSFIEDYLRHSVMPFYANTHTETSLTGAQSGQLREQARTIIREAVNAKENDNVLFCGNGATTAINKLIDILNLRLPADLAGCSDLIQNIEPCARPLVLIGPYEHHSNELPWRESIAQVINIPLTHDGHIDLCVLEQTLKSNKHRNLLIGSFSAASNVTGIKTPIEKITALLHQYGALSFWDYAAAAPYVPIDMNPNDALGDTAKDAVFISPHKFIGGPDTPGVLIVKSKLLNNSIPSVVGGGTVSYVTPDKHYYVDHLERREEGGTPSIIGTIRAGLAFKLQQEVGTDYIQNQETEFINQAIQHWQDKPNIEILGNPAAKRLSIVSLRIKHQGKDLHYGFLTALLNDLFGIQARGGCSCAGPYGHALLNLDANYSALLQQHIQQGYTLLRPGWVRLNFNYFLDKETVEYIIQAIVFIAQHACKMLPYYCYDEATGTWRYQNKEKRLYSSLLNWTFEDMPENCAPNTVKQDLQTFLKLAEKEVHADKQHLHKYSIHLSDSAKQLCWFRLPQEVAEL